MAQTLNLAISIVAWLAKSITFLRFNRLVLLNLFVTRQTDLSLTVEIVDVEWFDFRP